MNTATPALLVLGMGRSGQAMARWGVRQGMAVTVADTRPDQALPRALRQSVPEAQAVVGPFDQALWQRAPWSVVWRSPGLSPAQTHIIEQAAAEAGVPVQGELDVFMHALAQQAAEGVPPKVLAVTGTNGKTTVANLTHHLLRGAGWDVALAGNVGPTLLEVLESCVAKHRWPQAWVLELSSFQLAIAQPLQATAAAWLNLSEDHLDWHGDMAAYAQAKQRIFGAGTERVLCRDDAWLSQHFLTPQTTPREKRRRQPMAETVVSFGTDLPTRPGDWGMDHRQGMWWLVRAHPDAEPQAQPMPLQHLMPAAALKIQGLHNASNALAALALATQAGAPLAPMLRVLRDYSGEPHRVRPLATVDDVVYIDDSKGTNVGATCAALQGIGAQRRVVVILGGDGKGQNFTPLLQPLQQVARAAVLIGRDAQRLAELLQPTTLNWVHATDMDDAVQQAQRLAQPGDAVLLSPACASFDMYRNYVHRAEVFAQAVQRVAEERGVVC